MRSGNRLAPTAPIGEADSGSLMAPLSQKLQRPVPWRGGKTRSQAGHASRYQRPSFVGIPGSRLRPDRIGFPCVSPLSALPRGDLRDRQMVPACRYAKPCLCCQQHSAPPTSRPIGVVCPRCRLSPEGTYGTDNGVRGPDGRPANRPRDRQRRKFSGRRTLAREPAGSGDRPKMGGGRRAAGYRRFGS